MSAITKDQYTRTRTGGLAEKVHRYKIERGPVMAVAHTKDEAERLMDQRVHALTPDTLRSMGIL